MYCLAKINVTEISYNIILFTLIILFFYRECARVYTRVLYAIWRKYYCRTWNVQYVSYSLLHITISVQVSRCFINSFRITYRGFVTEHNSFRCKPRGFARQESNPVLIHYYGHNFCVYQLLRWYSSLSRLKR